MTSSTRPRSLLAFGWGLTVVLAGCSLYLFQLDPALTTRWGDRQLRAANLVAAENAYHRALSIDPDHAPALYGLGWAYLRAGLPDPAREQFRRAVDVAPDYFGGYRGLARLDLAAGAVDEAETKLRRAHELAPQEAGVLADLADLYLAAGHTTEGLDLYQRAVTLDPGRPEFRLGLAEVLLDGGDLEGVREQLELVGDRDVRDKRFEAAAEELFLRLELAELELSLSQGGDACDGAPALLDSAQQHLDSAREAGLERGMLAQDSHRLEKAREMVAARCGGSRTATAAAPDPERVLQAL